MVKLLLLYKKPPDEKTFEARYAQNLALLERMPNILRRQANMVVGGPGGASPYYRILELYFADFKALDRAMTSEAGQAAGRDLIDYAGDVVELMFVDVFEDDSPPAMPEADQTPTDETE